MSRNALQLNAMKCPPDSSPQGDQSSNPNRNLTLRLQRGGLRLDSAEQFVTFIKIEHACMHLIKCISEHTSAICLTIVLILAILASCLIQTQL